VFASERLHGDDTAVPVLAKGKTTPGALGFYVPGRSPVSVGSPRRRCSITRAIGCTRHQRRRLGRFRHPRLDAPSGADGNGWYREQVSVRAGFDGIARVPNVTFAPLGMRSRQGGCPVLRSSPHANSAHSPAGRDTLVPLDICHVSVTLLHE
jgi:hypothetical protein